VVMCVKLEEELRGWDTTSPLVSNKVFEISGQNN
jgi:hypothetical protein